MSITSPVQRPSHGGDLHVEAMHLDGQHEPDLYEPDLHEKNLYEERLRKRQTLDLSSAVSPFAYQHLNDIADAWTRLPYVSGSVQQTMDAYYRSVNFRVIPGTQWAIEYLPKTLSTLLTSCATDVTEQVGLGVNAIARADSAPALVRVALPRYGYAEHAYHWSRLTNVRCEFYDGLPSAAMVDAVDVCVVINPNNPLGSVYPAADMLRLMQVAFDAKTWLVIDETFVDFLDGVSVSHHLSEDIAERTIILRSFGKFSGLPGARVGALGAHTSFLVIIDNDFPLWGVAGPSLQVYARVLNDAYWLNNAKQQVQASARCLNALLNKYFEGVQGRALLFCTVFTEHAPSIFKSLLGNGIYVRLLDDKSGLRFSLPANADEFSRLEAALEKAVTPAHQVLMNRA